MTTLGRRLDCVAAAIWQTPFFAGLRYDKRGEGGWTWGFCYYVRVAMLLGILGQCGLRVVLHAVHQRGIFEIWCARVAGCRSVFLPHHSSGRYRSEFLK